jgi:ketosteroid isomerase-like protein
MRASTMTAAALAAALALAGCERNEDHKAGQNASADTAAAADAIRADEMQWNRDYAARDVDAIMRHYADDGTLTGPGDNPQSGGAAIRATVARMVGDPNFRLEFAQDRAEVARSGDLGFTRGHFTLTFSDPAGRPGTMRGTYLTVWRKQADGSWKAVEDMITPGPAPAPGP